MATEKTFDRADLLRFFHETEDAALVGKFAVIYPPTPQQLAFDQDATQGETTRYGVAAETVALYCERYSFSVVLHSVNIPHAGRAALPKHHPLRDLAETRRTFTRYGGTSAQLVRWAAELADEWKAEVQYALPESAIDLRRRRDDPGGADDRAPTGETIDDVLAQHGGDEDESEATE